VPPPHWRSRRLKVRRPHPCPTPKSPDFAIVLRPPHDLDQDRSPQASAGELDPAAALAPRQPRPAGPVREAAGRASSRPTA
jgi:hypothetical protein